MATLSFHTTTEEFSQFLLDTFGIEDNDISVEVAARAAKGSAWPSYCQAWGQEEEGRYVERPEAAPTREEGR